MQKISLTHPVLSAHRIVFISIGILSVLLLASCGGDDSTRTQSADGSIKRIQAVSGSTAVPGTWTGRAPKMEVINGITVPPEPAPDINNATLAGVDVNNNGVRDDVERRLAEKSIYSPIAEVAAQKALTTIGEASAIAMISLECGVGGASVKVVDEIKKETYSRDIDMDAYVRILDDYYKYKEGLPKQSAETWISDCKRLGVK